MQDLTESGAGLLQKFPEGWGVNANWAREVTFQLSLEDCKIPVDDLGEREHF